MKRTLSVILCVCLLISAFSVGSYASLTSAEIYSAYDYNNDGNVDLLDARTVLRVSSCIEAPIEGKDYDVDKSGNPSPDYKDVKAVLYIALGISTENIVVDDTEYMLNLFRKELNSIKDIRPGFYKHAEATCESMLVTTRNAPDDSLNVTDMEFDDYTNKTCDYMEDLLDTAGLLIPSSKKAELRANIAELRQKAIEMYKTKETKKNVLESETTHYTDFPINNLGFSCYLTVDDIKSIETKEEDGYIIRTVTMNEDTYIGNEYPTGTSGFKQRYQEISYGKVFNIPALSETDGSVVNKVTFKDGVIVSKIDKLTGVPVSVKYSYTYIADVKSATKVDENGEPGIEMTSKTTMKTIEEYTINPVEVN